MSIHSERHRIIILTSISRVNYQGQVLYKCRMHEWYIYVALTTSDNLHYRFDNVFIIILWHIHGLCEYLSVCMLICSSCHALRVQLSISTHSFIDTPQHHMMHKQYHAHCKHSKYTHVISPVCYTLISY